MCWCRGVRCKGIGLLMVVTYLLGTALVPCALGIDANLHEANHQVLSKYPGGDLMHLSRSNVEIPVSLSLSPSLSLSLSLALALALALSLALSLSLSLSLGRRVKQLELDPLLVIIKILHV